MSMSIKPGTRLFSAVCSTEMIAVRAPGGEVAITIGGVAPVAHLQEPVTLIDRELFRFEEIWAAAGHPHGVFKLRPHDLERLTGAPVADVVQEPPGA